MKMSERIVIVGNLIVIAILVGSIAYLIANAGARDEMLSTRCRLVERMPSELTSP